MMMCSKVLKNGPKAGEKGSNTECGSSCKETRSTTNKKENKISPPNQPTRQRTRKRKKEKERNLTRHETVVVGIRQRGKVRNHIFRLRPSPDHFLESWEVIVSVLQIVVPETIQHDQQQSLVRLRTHVERHVQLHFLHGLREADDEAHEEGVKKEGQNLSHGGGC